MQNKTVTVTVMYCNTVATWHLCFLMITDGRVEIVWNNGRTNHHEGFFPPGWLQANSYSQYNHTSVIDDSVPTPEVAVS